VKTVNQMSPLGWLLMASSPRFKKNFFEITGNLLMIDRLSAKGHC
jgi:hypothetical protein